MSYVPLTIELGSLTCARRTSTEIFVQRRLAQKEALAADSLPITWLAAFPLVSPLHAHVLSLLTGVLRTSDFAPCS